MRKKVFKRMSALFLGVSMAAAALVPPAPVNAAYTPETAAGGIIGKFNNPDQAARPMLRYWVPDAGCSKADLKEEMASLKEAGFGGVEIGNVPHHTRFDNAEYGWGSDNWLKMMSNILDIADELGDFRVDFTITAHWPASLNTIDPNDDVATKETGTAYVKLTADDLKNGSFDVPMPEVKTEDKAGNPFIFKQELITAVAAQVDTVDASGSYTVKTDTMKVLETAKTAKTTVAGIPKLEGKSAEVQNYVKGLYEGKEPDTMVFFTDSKGKTYANPAREALADTQEYYSVDLTKAGISSYTASQGEALAPGDWVLYGIWQVGTGNTQMSNDGMMTFQDPMPGVTYEFNLFSKEAAEGLTGYWENMLTRADTLKLGLRGKMEKRQGSIFEDSLENKFSSGSVFWSKDFLTQFKTEFGYDIEPYLPLLTAKEYQESGGFGPATNPKTYPGIANQDAKSQNIARDFNEFLSDIYISEHVKTIEEYFNDLGWSYRGQGYHTSGLTMDTSAISAALDMADGESLAWDKDYDRFRAVAGGVHLAGKKYVSDEALANMMDTYKLNWESALQTINANYAAGVNRMIVHGTSFRTTKGEAEYSQWPGWHAFGSMFADPWGSRMAYWDDVDTMTGYMARTQAVLQNGSPSLDLLVYDLNTFKATPEGERDKSVFRTLLDNGYTYDVTTTDNLGGQDSGYKAVVVNNMEAIPLEGAAKLKGYAEAGKTVIFLGQKPGKSMSAENTDQEIAAAVAEIPNAVTVKDQAELLAYLKKTDGLDAYAEYSAENVRTVRRVDATDNTAYYFVFNNSEEDQNITLNLEGAEGATVAAVYDLDAWTGDVSQVVKSEVKNNIAKVEVSLEGEEATILAVTETQTGAVNDFPATETIEPTVIVDSAMFYDNVDQKIKVKAAREEKAQKLESWNLSLESWGPNDPGVSPTNPTLSKKTTADFTDIKLVSWKALGATAEQLKTLGVDAMKEVSGIGTYTATFNFEKNGANGAYLELSHQTDMVTDITVNGNSVGKIDQSKNRFDIGSYVENGKNTVVVKVVSTMNNRVSVENDGYKGGGGFPGGPGGAAADSSQEYGLVSASVIPYDILSEKEAAAEFRDSAKQKDSEQQETIRQQEEELAKQQEELAKQQQELAEKQEAYNKKQQELAEKQKEAERLQKLADEKAQEAAGSQAATEQQRKAAETARADADKAKKELETARTAAETAKKELAAAQAKAKSAQEKADRLVFQAKKITLSKVTSPKKKQMKATWKKVSGASGYEIQYALKSNFKGKKTVDIKSGKAKSKTVSKLKSGKKYYVRIRAYKKIGGKKAYTAYSSKKTVKVK